MRSMSTLLTFMPDLSILCSVVIDRSSRPPEPGADVEDRPWWLRIWPWRPRGGLDLVLIRDDACLDSDLARLAISRVRPGTRIAFVGFEAPLGHEVQLMPIDCDDSRRAAIARLRESRPDGWWTRWADALRAVIDVTVEDRAGHRRVVLAVSGRPVGGGRVNWAR